jgi:hypothetical protein
LDVQIRHQDRRRSSGDTDHPADADRPPMPIVRRCRSSADADHPPISIIRQS